MYHNVIIVTELNMSRKNVAGESAKEKSRNKKKEDNKKK